MTLTIAAQLKTSNRDVDQLVHTAIESFGFAKSAGSKVALLSGGEKRRLSIACEMLTNPKIVIMDEPLSGLDAATALEVMRWLRKVADERRLIVVMTIHMPSTDIWHLFDKLHLIEISWVDGA
jgi:ABC-type multidrug transport system ATPase subunit